MATPLQKAIKYDRHKKDLVGYCGTHGEDRRHIYPELEPAQTRPSGREG